MRNFLKWHNQKHPDSHHILAFLIGALIFPTGIPACLVLILPQVDAYYGIGSFFYGVGNVLIGAAGIIVGFCVSIWTVVVQVNLASGTPFPILPTKKLLIVGPFQYCRDPMTLGTIIAYGGVAILVGSLAALIAVAVLAVTLICYLKFIEEKELELRFGDEYLEYKKTTPFMIPKIFAEISRAQ